MQNSLLRIIYAESKLLIPSQAAGVKRLLFCGVGCQVQGIIIVKSYTSFFNCFIVTQTIFNAE